MSKSELNLKRYNALEHSGMELLPNRVIEAFKPITFQHLGYPTNVNHDKELWKFSDVMHENSFQNNFEEYLGGLSLDEFKLFKELSKLSSNMIYKKYNKKLAPTSCLIAALILLRHIKYFFPNDKINIFEIGPGSGYLGCLLSMLGHNYYCTDNTTGFYLFQNKLFQEVAKGKFLEVANVDRKLIKDKINKISKNPPNGKIIHIPWWQFANFISEPMNLNIDCVIATGVLAEMNHNALGFFLNKSKGWLRNSNNNSKLIYVGGLGAGVFNTYAQVFAKFKSKQLKMCYPKKDTEDIFYYYTPFEIESLKKEKSIISQFNLLNRKKKLVYGWDIKQKNRLICVDETSKKSFGNIIKNGRKKDRLIARIKKEKIKEFQQKLIQNKNIKSEDEIFLDICESQE